MTAPVLSEEVRAALGARRPVVALESTIIAHGLPWPGNLETARMLESDLREEGAVPATIAVLDGALRVGLGAGELERLARDGKSLAKLGTRDLGAMLALVRDGATTVSATMAIAHRTGIRVFATGGIGGVHRGAELSGDVSADLIELARTPVAVVSAGAKAILDLPRTLEMLETLGVPVIGHGTDLFPAFWCRDFGLKLELRADTPDQIARILAAHWALGQAGVLVANPIPLEAALDRALIESAIARALAEASRAGIGGKDVTPFLLARVEQETGGRSVAANVALVRNNVRVAARIAASLCAIAR
jgi:pseudouridylate synthase